MSRARDSQRARVYAWENAAVEALTGRDIEAPEFATLPECDAFAAPIWRKERGRVGLAKLAAPTIERPSRGQRRAIAHDDHRITLPRWARSRWVILHEMAHRLTPQDEAHGPRFVGVLIGLACRWLDFDADMLMQRADAMGVRYHVRSIGVVPVHGPAWHLRRALAQQRPMTAIDLASWLSIGEGVDITAKQVRGAALPLIRAGQCRWLRGKLTPVSAPALADDRAPQPRKTAAVGPWRMVRNRAEACGVTIDSDGGRGWFVTHDAFTDSDDVMDPLEGNHYCATLSEVCEAVSVYEEACKRTQGVAA